MKYYSYRIKYYNKQHKLVLRRGLYFTYESLILDHIYSNGSFIFIPVELVSVYDDDNWNGGVYVE